MFKTAATRIAHNSVIPALGGNKDLRPLQDLITAEKAIVQSLVKLSGDLTKASEALRNWGLGEGEDLGDTLSCSTAILSHFSSAISKFASHEQSIRDHMKSVRTGEESLDELKRRRKTVASKADSAERKLHKMNPEHKNLQAQTDLLNQLRDEIRSLDSQIMTDEAKLGDLKRSATKSWMTLKFGGIEELSRKGVIIGEAGKLLISEIPQDLTQPGGPRSYYTGNQTTEKYVAEAQQALSQIAFNGYPPSDRLPENASNEYRLPHPTDAPQDDSSFMGMYMTMPEPDRFNPGNASGLQVNELGALSSQGDVSHSQTLSSLPLLSENGDSPSSLDVSAVRGAGGQFATFPVRGGRPGMLTSPLSEGNERNMNQSFSSSVAEALGSPRVDTSEKAPSAHLPLEPDGPAPSYDLVAPPFSQEYAPPAGPPPGAAPPAIQGLSYGEYSQQRVNEDQEDSQLPWMEPSKAERRLRFASRPVELKTPQRQSFANGLDIASGSPLPSPEPSGQHRPASPPMAPTLDLDEEKALNAAAAREVSRELDALTFSPPHPPALPSPSAQPTPSSPSHPLPPPPPPLSTASMNAPSPSSPRQTDSPSHPTSPFTRNRDREGISPTPRSPVEPLAPRRSSSPNVPSPNLPSSPIHAPQPPPPPPSISLPPPAPVSSPQSDSNFATPQPYRTPPEYPAVGLGTSPSTSPKLSFSRPHVTPPPPPPSGMRTISAAAFRRPQNRVPSEGSFSAGSAPSATDTSPLSFKKRGLPSSPYALRPGGHGSSASLSQSQPLPVSPAQTQSPPAVVEDDQFDYISAYANETDDHQPSKGEGFASGRYATNLENSELQ